MNETEAKRLSLMQEQLVTIHYVVSKTVPVVISAVTEMLDKLHELGEEAAVTSNRGRLVFDY
jgi:hypothetical protein